MVNITKGLNVPIAGIPEPAITYGPVVSRVALVADDYVGMKPTMLVREGESVKLGQPLFADKKTEGIVFTSPGCGRVRQIVRGNKRKFESLVIDLEGEEEEKFRVFDDLGSAGGEDIVEQLTASGLWTALRTRPYSKVPSPQSRPHSIFVTAIDTNPLAADPVPIISAASESFALGLQALSKLTEGLVYVCHAGDGKIPGRNIDRVEQHVFTGPHPAGLVGTHIHFLDPVSAEKTVWHINYQDVIAFGRLFQTGSLSMERVIALGGPVIEKPRLLTTRLGANLPELLDGEVKPDLSAAARGISGSVLSGRTATAPLDYLGRYHLQATVLMEGTGREFLGWQQLGWDKYSVKRVFASGFRATEPLPMTTSIEGSRRAMVPIGSYEQIMPLDILPTFLLRALIVEDTEQAQLLGCLELDEEDLALCTYVCPGKYEYGSILRRNLSRIEQEG